MLELFVGLAAAAGVAAVAIAQGLHPTSVVALAVAGAALGVGRRHARTVWLSAVAALLATAARGDETDAFLVLVPAVAYCAGRWDTRWGGVAGLFALLGAELLCLAIPHDSPADPFVILPVATWIAARTLAERARVADQLAQRARELELEREAHAALAVRYERARIASELHDIVAHAISVMVVQASAGQRLAAHDPAATADAFEAIAGAAREAEEDMGRLVALLGGEDSIGPAPDLTLVEEIVARATGSGLAVTLRLEGEREGLPAAVVETVCHVVREGLTNALRYAAGGAVAVLVRRAERVLVVEVVNAPAPHDAALAGTGTGNGLRGLRERVDASGGRLEAGSLPGGGWRLRARLPLSPVRVSEAGEVHPSG